MWWAEEKEVEEEEREAVRKQGEEDGGRGARPVSV